MLVLCMIFHRIFIQRHNCELSQIIKWQCYLLDNSTGQGEGRSREGKSSISTEKEYKDLWRLSLRPDLQKYTVPGGARREVKAARSVQQAAAV